MTDELRDKIAATILQAPRARADQYISARRAGELADVVLAISEIAAALRQSKMIADEPTMTSRYGYVHASMPTAVHDAIFARLRKAGTDG